jgi:hypothetical protein
MHSPFRSHSRALRAVVFGTALAGLLLTAAAPSHAAPPPAAKHAPGPGPAGAPVHQ